MPGAHQRKRDDSERTLRAGAVLAGQSCGTSIATSAAVGVVRQASKTARFALWVSEEWNLSRGLRRSGVHTQALSTHFRPNGHCVYVPPKLIRMSKHGGCEHLHCPELQEKPVGQMY